MTIGTGILLAGILLATMTRLVTARLHQRRFFSLGELNVAIAGLVSERPLKRATVGSWSDRRNQVLGVTTLFASILLALGAMGAFAQPVAICSELEGYSYYHYGSLVPKESGGFQKDAISGGLTTLQRLENGDYDILIVDARKRVISYRQDGGLVRLLRRGTSDATFLVVFPGMTIELYTFYTDAGGTQRFDLLHSKGGDELPIHKSSVMTGRCSEIHLNLVR